MSNFRANSSPSLLQSSHKDHPMMEGVSTNLKLLMKLIEDYNQGSASDETRTPQRLAGMIGILNDMRFQIEKSQMAGQKKQAELRRCNTDLRRNPTPILKDKRPMEPMEENIKLRKDLAASHAARKSLERMFSGLGKEKEIMASELARKARELSDMEEHIADLKAQNGLLMGKAKTCAAEHRGEKGRSSGIVEEHTKLGDRNKELSDQLLKSVDKYRMMKRKFRDVREHNLTMQMITEQISHDVEGCLCRIQELRRNLAASRGDSKVDIAEELSLVELNIHQLHLKAVEAGRWPE